MGSGYGVFIGSSDIDEYYACEHWPALGDKALVRFMESKVGGMIANAASIYSAYGADTYMLSVLGSDAYTDIILDDLRKDGIHTDFLDFDPDNANGKTHIMLTGSERTIFVVVNPDKRKLVVDERKRALLLGADFVYSTIAELKKIEGHRALLSDLRLAGVRLALDVESESFTGREEDAFFFREAGILIFNEFAVEKYASGSDREKAFTQLVATDGKIVVWTLGAEGCVLRTNGEEIRVHGIRVSPVDTTGAGDTFNASFLYGLNRGWDLRRAAVFANGAAARSTLELGPKSGIASARQIEKFIEQAGV